MHLFTRKWTAGACKANGIDIHYLRTGGNKPPVVLLHGLMTNGACWTPLARTLQQDCDVILPDARGHGKSSAPDQGYTYKDLATDVLSLIETLGLAPPILIGHSMGGMTAAVAASLNPKRLRGLVLADPTFLTPKQQKEVYESDVLAQHHQVLQQSPEDFFIELRRRHKHRSLELIELFAKARFQTSLHAFAVLKPPNPDYQELIKTLDLPCLLITGSVNPVVSPALAAELTQLNPHLKVAQIADAGHGVPYDQPERFLALVQAFLKTQLD